jgi:glycosyltransferase involved in cell wall biosynthesis
MARRDYKVAVGSAAWQLNGVNVFAGHLTRGLVQRGLDAHVFFTEQDTGLVQLPSDMMPFPADLPSVEIDVPRDKYWDAHWYETIRYLEQLAPCVYLPNSDFRHSCVSPMLSPNVCVIGVIQGDDPVHYEHVHRLGKYWDAIVAVSEEIAEKVVAQDPEFRPRVHVIPNTVVVPPTAPPRDRKPGGPIRIVYHGVLNTYQKLILHLPRILEEMEKRGVPFRLTVAGDGPQRDELLEASRRWLDAGTMQYKGLVPHERIDELLREHDCYIMTSRFEGMPHAVLEAMSQGCIPVVTDIASGVPEVVEDGKSGFIVPVGDFAAFAERFGRLQQDLDLQRRMSEAAHRSIQSSRFTVDAMVEQYIQLFDRTIEAARTGRYRRPRGRILPPPAECNGLSIFPVETAGYIAEVERMVREKPPAKPVAPPPRRRFLAGLLRSLVGD